MNIKRIVKTNVIPTLQIRLTAGLIFLSGGLQKLITPEVRGRVGRFAKIGFSDASFWAYFTGPFEKVSGVSILIRLLTRLAAFLLIIIMIIALSVTKCLFSWVKVYWLFAHEYRTEWV